MKRNTPIILIVDDDEGHAILVRENLEAAGVRNPIRYFPDGEAFLGFLFHRGPGGPPKDGQSYLALLDIRMPKLDGIEVLRRIKTHPDLHKLPVIMLTTTDDAREMDRCYELGCNAYIQKPVDYEKFAETIRRLGLFLTLLQTPLVSGA